jgi:hypothetical protein
LKSGPEAAFPKSKELVFLCASLYEDYRLKSSILGNMAVNLFQTAFDES